MINPEAIFPLLPAKTRIVPRTGPIHGVQARAIISPKIKAFKDPVNPAGILFWRLKLINGSLKAPRVWRPNKIIIIPPNLESSNCLLNKNCPIQEAETPSRIKIIEKPVINARAGFKRAHLELIFLGLLPVKIPRYEGIKGSIQGENIDKTPAVKASGIVNSCCIKNSILSFANYSNYITQV